MRRDSSGGQSTIGSTVAPLPKAGSTILTAPTPSAPKISGSAGAAGRAGGIWNGACDGEGSSASIGSRAPSNCYNILQIQNGNWTKVDDPATGFRCDGSYVP